MEIEAIHNYEIPIENINKIKWSEPKLHFDFPARLKEFQWKYQRYSTFKRHTCLNITYYRKGLYTTFIEK